MNRFQNACAALLCAAAANAWADTFEGQLAWHNDVIRHSFTIAETSHLVAWTDSYRNGENFDPIVAVWRDGQLLGQVDDDPSVTPEQTVFDSGLRLYDLAPGTYLFTIGAYNNFANSSVLADGFWFDVHQPIPLGEWCQPAGHCNMGPDVRLNWTLNPVPEPSAWMLLAAGIALVGAYASRWRCTP